MNTDEETIYAHRNSILTRKREREEKELSTQDDIISNESNIQIQNLRQSYDNVFSFDWKDKIIRDNQQIFDNLKPNSLWFIYSNFYFNSQKLKTISENDSNRLINHLIENTPLIKKSSSKNERNFILKEINNICKCFFNQNTSLNISDILKCLVELQKKNEKILKKVYTCLNETLINEKLNEQLKIEINDKSQSLYKSLYDEYYNYNDQYVLKSKVDYIKYLKKKMSAENILRLNKPKIFDTKSELNSIKNEDERICFVCNNGGFDNQQILFECQNCHITVHPNCYGIDTDDSYNWMCDVCLYIECHDTKCTQYEFKCLLCPVLGGAMKQVNIPNDSSYIQNLQKYKNMFNNQNDINLSDIPKYNSSIIIPKDNYNLMDRPWVHLSCALWNPNINFGNFEKKNEIDNIDSLSFHSYFDECSICNQKGKGPTVKCFYSECTCQFHPECARINHYTLEVENCQGALNYNIYCLNHRPVKYQKLKTQKLTEKENDIYKFGKHLNKIYKNYEKEYKHPLFEHNNINVKNDGFSNIRNDLNIS